MMRLGVALGLAAAFALPISVQAKNGGGGGGPNPSTGKALNIGSQTSGAGARKATPTVINPALKPKVTKTINNPTPTFVRKARELQLERQTPRE